MADGSLTVTASGAVIEAKLDVGRGPVATVLVRRGTLKRGDIVVAGAQWGRVKALNNERGQLVDTALPATPVEVLGLDGAPDPGDWDFLDHNAGDLWPLPRGVLGPARPDGNLARSCPHSSVVGVSGLLWSHRFCATSAMLNFSAMRPVRPTSNVTPLTESNDTLDGPVPSDLRDSRTLTHDEHPRSYGADAPTLDGPSPLRFPRVYSEDAPTRERDAHDRRQVLVALARRRHLRHPDRRRPLPEGTGPGCSDHRRRSRGFGVLRWLRSALPGGRRGRGLLP